MNAETGPDSFDAYLQAQLSHADKRRSDLSSAGIEPWPRAKPAQLASRHSLPDEPAIQAGLSVRMAGDPHGTYTVTAVDGDYVTVTDGTHTTTEHVSHIVSHVTPGTGT